MNIIHITSEVLPFSYAGSMAETLFCLPYAEKRDGHQVTVLSPLYASVDTAKHNIKSLQLKTWVNAGFAVYEFELFETLIDFAENTANESGVDKSRIYLTGVSMGAYAAWQLAMTRPDV